MACLSRPYHFRFFKGCLAHILLGPFLNTLTQMWYAFHLTHSFSAFNFILLFCFSVDVYHSFIYHFIHLFIHSLNHPFNSVKVKKIWMSFYRLVSYWFKPVDKEKLILSFRLMLSCSIQDANTTWRKMNEGKWIISVKHYFDSGHIVCFKTPAMI